MASGFWRSVVSVITGTALAQLFPVLGSLVLARQFAPAEFGVFFAWLGVVLLLSVALTGRFETALAIEPDGEPRRLAVIAILSTIALAAALSGVFLVAAVALQISWLTDLPSLLIGLLIPAAMSIAVAQTWFSWAAAEGRYRKLSAMRIAQAAAITTIQITAGTIFSSASALAISHLLGVIVGLAISAKLLPLRTLPIRGFARTIRTFWSRHRRFPQFSLPAGVINTAAVQLPVLIVASRFGADVAGLLAMTIRMLGAPIALLGVSVLDVFKRHAAVSFQTNGECRHEYVRTFRGLMLGSIIFFIVMAVSSEALFAVAFGEAWRDAGTIAVWLLPLFALRFVANPLSYMVFIAGKQHVDLVWQIALLTMTFASLTIPEEHGLALKAYSGGYSLLYVIYLAMTYRLSLGSKR